jgi:PAS domain S-box-containing protein
LDLYLGAPMRRDGREIGVAVARTAGLQVDSLAEYPSRSGWAIEPFLVAMRPDSTLQFILPTGTRVDSLVSGQSRRGDYITTELLQARRDTLLPDLVDYRGVPVLAAVRFVESADWGLVVRVDQEKAYAPVRRFRNHTLVALAGVALAAVLVSLVVSRRLTRRLLELITVAREFSAGRLSRRAPGCEARDELGELSRSLNAMAENLVSRKELQAYIDQMSTLSAKLDLQGRVVMANRAGRIAFARPESEIIGRNFLLEPWYRCDAAAAERMRMAFSEARSGKTVSREETFLGDGMRVHLSITFSPVRDAFGAVAYIIAEGRDVTALKDAQAALYEVNEGLEESVRERTESLQEALREKEMLLKEIHHRVKNNLQIISSLLSLQSVHVRDPEVAGILTESRNRVKSMALVHERLYAGDDLGNSGFTGYIRDLAAQLVRSSEAQRHNVLLEFDLEEIPVGLSQAIPCGLAIHELVANSLKHAFPGGWASSGVPRVVIRSRALPDGGFELEVEDNGAGLPEGFDPRKSRTLGLQLVFTLIKQLKGVLEVGRGGGTRMRIAIPGAE